MADKFPPGFEFGVPVRSGATAAPAAGTPAPGAEFGVTVPTQPEPLPPPAVTAPQGMSLRAGEAGFGAPPIPAGFQGPQASPRDLRTVVEGGAAGAGEIAGARFGGPLGAVGGAAAGGFAGATVSQLFDPVEEPIKHALEVGATAAAVSGAFASGLAGVRRAVGKPNEAGEWLIAQAEKEGRVPPAGALFPDSALIRNAQAVGQADIAFGQRVTEALEASRGGMTDELRQYLHSYTRVKSEADRAFRRVDTIIEQTVGAKGVVTLNEDLLRASEPLIESWKRLGLDSKPKINLVGKLEAAAAAREAGQQVLPRLSFAETQALYDRLYRASIDMRRGTVSGKQALGGTEFADAYQSFARETRKAMDDAIDSQIKTGAMPMETKAALQGARTLWKSWKSGEAMIDAIDIELRAAAREGGILDSGTLFTAVKNLDRLADKTGKSIITKDQTNVLTGIARAMAQAEKTAKTSAFVWTVRAGQLGLITGGASVFGPGAAAPSLFIAATPALLAWLTTNKTATQWLIRGMRTEAGTAAGLRLAEQLATAAAREGLFPATSAQRQEIERSKLLLGRESQDLFLRTTPGPSPVAVPQRNPALPGVNPSFSQGTPSPQPSPQNLPPRG